MPPASRAGLATWHLVLIAGLAVPATPAAPVPSPSRVQLTLEPSATSVVIDEPFTVRLRIRMPVVADNATELPPLHPLHAPHLTIPYLEYMPPSGLIRPHVRQLLGPLLLQNPRAPGFRINALTADSAPAGWITGIHQREARFALEHSRLATRRGAEHVFSLDTPFHGERPGRFTFGPVDLQGRVITGLEANGHALTEQVSVQAEAVTVTVHSPPPNGRPPGYSGAIGRSLAVEAELDTQICNMGDPLTLTLTLRGDVRLDRITAPPLDQFPALTQAFRVYASSARSESGEDLRRFHYTIRPIKAGTLEVPRLPLAYYDLDTHRYRIVWTEPIPVRAYRITEAELPGRSGAVRLGAVPDTAVPAPFRYPTRLTSAPPRFAPWLHLPLTAAGPVTWLLLAGADVRRRRRQIARDVSGRRSVLHATHRRLVTLGTIDQPGRSDWQALHAVVSDLLTHIAGLAPGAVTPQAAERELAARGWAGTAHQAGPLLETIAAAVFATSPPGPDAFATAVRDAATLATAMARGIDTGSRGVRHALARGLIGCLLLAPLPTTLGAVTARPADAIAFRAREAGALIRRAHTPEQFLDAARAYQGLLEAGVVNADIYYNLGTALLLAERPDAAVPALEAAERIGGADWETRRNLRLAMGEKAHPRWSRTVCFWHYLLGQRLRTTLAALAFLTAWGGLILTRLGVRPGGRIVAGTAAVLFLVFASSVLVSITQSGRTRARLALDLTGPAMEVAP